MMIIKSFWKQGLGVFLGIGLLFLACEYESPKAIWDPNEDLHLESCPVISRIVPPQIAAPGVLTISIYGKNFSPNPNQNWVYFGSTKAEIKTCTDTLITVYRPNVTGTKLPVIVVVQDAYLVAKDTTGYAIPAVWKAYGSLPSAWVVEAFAFDKQENLYVARLTKEITKIDPTEVRTDLGVRTYKKKTTDMKIAPDGSILLLETGSNKLHRIPPAGGDSQPYADLAAKVSYFDFDANGNILAGGDKQGIAVLKADLTSRVVGDDLIKQVKIIWLKVYNGYVYVADAGTVYRAPILSSDGDLGSTEKVFEMASVSRYASAKIFAFALSEEGKLYIATSHSDAVFIYDPNTQTTEPLYKNIIPANSGPIVWGNGTYLYLYQTQVAGSNTMIRIDTGKREASK